MNIDAIVEELRNERDKLNAAIAALEGGGSHAPQRATTAGRRKRGNMSAAARAKLSRLLKKRWAARRKAGKLRLG